MYSYTAGTVRGCTVTTATSGGGMPPRGCEAASPQPASSAARAAADSAAERERKEAEERTLMEDSLDGFGDGGRTAPGRERARRA